MLKAGEPTGPGRMHAREGKQVDFDAGDDPHWPPAASSSLTASTPRTGRTDLPGRQAPKLGDNSRMPLARPQLASSELPSPHATLCPALVIRNADEMVLSIVGNVVPSQQEEVLRIYEGVPPPPRSDPSLQAVISEGPHGRGISLETGRGHPLAFLDTWDAFRSGQRRVHVYHPPPSLGTGDRNSTALLFGAMEVCEPGQFVIRRRSGRCSWSHRAARFGQER